jgi:hypothetical protein
VASPAALAIKPGCDRRAPVRSRSPGIVTGLERPSVDPVLCRAVPHALAWMDQVRAGTSIVAIARTEDVSERFVAARLPLTLLSPQIVVAIEQGRQPALAEHGASGAHALSSDWDEQARLFGFESPITHFPLSTIRLPARSLKFPCKFEEILCLLEQGIAARTIRNRDLRRHLPLWPEGILSWIPSRTALNSENRVGDDAAPLGRLLAATPLSTKQGGGRRRDRLRQFAGGDRNLRIGQSLGPITQ